MGVEKRLPLYALECAFPGVRTVKAPYHATCISWNVLVWRLHTIPDSDAAIRIETLHEMNIACSVKTTTVICPVNPPYYDFMITVFSSEKLVVWDSTPHAPKNLKWGTQRLLLRVKSTRICTYSNSQRPTKITFLKLQTKSVIFH